MIVLTANELKTKGVSALRNHEPGEPISITVNGKPEFLVLSGTQIDEFRDFQLTTALNDAISAHELGECDVLVNHFDIDRAFN